MLHSISRAPAFRRQTPPILFIHGAWHGAWCWQENFLDFFSSLGFEAHALDLRGHGKSEGREHLKYNRIRHYVEDVKSFIATLPSEPILVGHSMGGFVVQKYLERDAAPGAVLLASVPPTGAWRTALRAIRDRPLTVAKMNLMASLKPLVEGKDASRKLFFSASMPDALFDRYYAQLQDESFLAYLDFLILDLVRTSRITTPMLVLGGSDDEVFHPSQIRATAKAYGVEERIFPGIAHDMMLEAGWKDVAAAIVSWIDREIACSSQVMRTAYADA